MAKDEFGREWVGDRAKQAFISRQMLELYSDENPIDLVAACMSVIGTISFMLSDGDYELALEAVKIAGEDMVESMLAHQLAASRRSTTGKDN